MSFGLLDQRFIMNFTYAHNSGVRLGAYVAARRRATLTRLIRKLQRKRHSLLPLPNTTNLEQATYLGVRQVPTTAIVGSVSRSRDFDAEFLPLEPVDEARWLRVYSAISEGVELPPIQLIKVDGQFFVLDGHHRVSVARLCGIEYIDAEVREYVFAPGGHQASTGQCKQVIREVSEQLFPKGERSQGTCTSSEDYIPNDALPSPA
ncbi:MAG: ParB/RepB/Spo0J family partition protein [Chloroflexota bacterium]|nr:ParB/RepB/Spo0J family partition protein [Chloroflexota bacterium]MDQ5864982.1 ParB/RepB/Spo0J family partition protein [Chloroflexota bacterium]